MELPIGRVLGTSNTALEAGAGVGADAAAVGTARYRPDVGLRNDRTFLDMILSYDRGALGVASFYRDQAVLSCRSGQHRFNCAAAACTSTSQCIF